MFTCPTCGKYTCAHWPEYWPYRRGPTYYCSWQCLDVDQVRDMQEMNKAIALHKGVIRLNKVNQKQKDKAVQMAIKGEDPRPFLASCGSKNPEKLWGYIRGCVKATNPELFAKIPARLNQKAVKPETPEAPKTAGEAMQNMQDAADKFFDQCKEAGLKLDGPKLEAPEPFEYKVTGIVTEIGEFWLVSGGKIKWVSDRMGKEDPVMQVYMTTTEPALTPEMWRRFADIILKVIDVLGGAGQ